MTRSGMASAARRNRCRRRRIRRSEVFVAALADVTAHIGVIFDENQRIVAAFDAAARTASPVSEVISAGNRQFVQRNNLRRAKCSNRDSAENLA